MANYDNFQQSIERPIRSPDIAQRWIPTLQNPYPMNFVQAPSPTNQVMVYYNGRPQLQGLSTVKGPVMFPQREITENPVNGWERKHTIYPRKNAAVYPTTHSIPGPFLQSYAVLPNRMYPY